MLVAQVERKPFGWEGARPRGQHFCARHPIEVGSSDGNRTQVTQGVKPGELVAVDLPAELGDGAVIQPSTH
jgi:hypothetical protein